MSLLTPEEELAPVVEDRDSGTQSEARGHQSV